jgi:hypothetical protein
MVFAFLNTYYPPYQPIILQNAHATPIAPLNIAYIFHVSIINYKKLRDAITRNVDIGKTLALYHVDNLQRPQQHQPLFECQTLAFHYK